MKKLLKFLKKLDDASIYYKLNKVRDSILVEVVVPGERWEVEFFEDGKIEIEKFISTGTIYDSNELKNLFDNFSD
jgi:hypothetical protein